MGASCSAAGLDLAVEPQADYCPKRANRHTQSRSECVGETVQALGVIRAQPACLRWSGGAVPGIVAALMDSLPFDTLRWTLALARSEERRVGKECRSRWSP